MFRLSDARALILTSKKTASGCESFAYNLKHLGRATIVGEQTSGAAHSVRTFDLAAKYRAFIPKARPVNPVTGTNWEARGVQPDVETTAADALHEALRLAAKRN